MSRSTHDGCENYFEARDRAEETPRATDVLYNLSVLFKTKYVISKYHLESLILEVNKIIANEVDSLLSNYPVQMTIETDDTYSKDDDDDIGSLQIVGDSDRRSNTIGDPDVFEEKNRIEGIRDPRTAKPSPPSFVGLSKDSDVNLSVGFAIVNISDIFNYFSPGIAPTFHFLNVVQKAFEDVDKANTDATRVRNKEIADYEMVIQNMNNVTLDVHREDATDIKSPDDRGVSNTGCFSVFDDISLSLTNGLNWCLNRYNAYSTFNIVKFVLNACIDRAIRKISDTSDTLKTDVTIYSKMFLHHVGYASAHVTFINSRAFVGYYKTATILNKKTDIDRLIYYKTLLCALKKRTVAYKMLQSKFDFLNEFVATTKRSFDDVVNKIENDDDIFYDLSALDNVVVYYSKIVVVLEYLETIFTNMKKYGSISPKTIEQNEPTVDDGSNKKLQTEQDVALVNIDDKLRFYYKTTTSCTKQKSKIEKNKDRIACASIITEETRYDPYKIATILEDFTFMANALTYDPVCDFDDYNV
jgi:hypothetical protein